MLFLGGGNKMSRKKPISIIIKDSYIEVKPEGSYRSEVVKSGNGEVIKFFKRFVKKKVIGIVEEKKK